MFGWLRAARTSASRWKRATRSGSLAPSGGSTLRATWRLRTVSDFVRANATTSYQGHSNPVSQLLHQTRHISQERYGFSRTGGWFKRADHQEPRSNWYECGGRVRDGERQRTDLKEWCAGTNVQRWRRRDRHRDEFSRPVHIEQLSAVARPAGLNTTSRRNLHFHILRKRPDKDLRPP